MAGNVMPGNPGVFLEVNVWPGDIACRYVGEEFVIVITMLDCEESLQRLENKRKIFQKMLTIYQDELFYATCSGRMVAFPQFVKVPQDIMMVVERVFYEAKAQGRNWFIDIHRSNE